MKYFCTPTRKAKMKTKSKLKPTAGKFVEQLKFSYTADGHVYWYKFLGNLLGLQCLLKLNTHLPYNLTSPIPGTHQRQKKYMSMVALFMITKTGKRDVHQQ